MIVGNEEPCEARDLLPRQSGSDAHAFRGVAPLRDRGSEPVELRQRPSVRIRDEQTHILEPVGEELGDPRLQRVEPLPSARGDLERARERMSDAPLGERVEQIDFVENQLERDVVGIYLGKDRMYCGDRLAKPFFW